MHHEVMENPLALAPASTPDDSTIKILISTDNHLGYNENDAIRGRDSFRSFEEMLAIGGNEKVDFVLLAGDLFHHNKPSRATMYHTMSLLRQHCLGDGEVNFQILSDQSINFPNFGSVNYEDPNMNIKLPIFSIHGNHDDPTGEAGRSLAALDLLSAANLMNYFGKSERVDEIEIFPILLEKGTTKLAIYGIGNMRDERLHRMFSQGNVRFRRPEEDPESWFSIFVVHQNRENRGRGAKNCLPESFIPEFIDFVIWGHEHECLIEVDESIKGNFYITQPGSSVITSLIEGETKEKKIGVLEILNQNFRLKSIPLKTARPFKFTEVNLSDQKHLNPHDPKVQELIDEAATEHPSHANEPSMQVLVRIKVLHTGFPILSNQRFGGQFVGKVANPADILLFKKMSSGNNDDAKSGTSSVSGILSEPIRPSAPTIQGVEEILSKHLSITDKKLDIFPETNIAHALEDFVFKGVATAFDDIIDTVLEETQTALKHNKSTMTKNDIQLLVEKNVERMKVAQAVRASQNEMDTQQVMRMLQAPPSKQFSDNESNINGDDNDTPQPAKRKTPATRKTMPQKRATPASKKKKAVDSDDVDSASDYEMLDDIPKKKPTATKTKAASTRKQKATTLIDSPDQHVSKRTKKQTNVSSFFQPPSQLPSSNTWREAPTQQSTQGAIVSQSTGRRKLPLSFSSFTQEDEPKPTNSSVAKGWGRARK